MHLLHQGYDPYEMEDDADESTATTSSLSTMRGSSRQTAEEASTSSAAKEITSQRLEAFKSSILKLLKEVRVKNHIVIIIVILKGSVYVCVCQSSLNV